MTVLVVDQDSERSNSRPRSLLIPFRSDVEQQTASPLSDPGRQRFAVDSALLLPVRPDKEDNRSPSVRYVMERSEGVTHALEVVMNLLARSRPTEGGTDLASIAHGSAVVADIVGIEVLDGCGAVLV
jgi:hypothetical protein